MSPFKKGLLVAVGVFAFVALMAGSPSKSVQAQEPLLPEGMHPALHVIKVCHDGAQGPFDVTVSAVIPELPEFPNGENGPNGGTALQNGDSVAFQIDCGQIVTVCLEIVEEEVNGPGAALVPEDSCAHMLFVGDPFFFFLGSLLVEEAPKAGVTTFYREDCVPDGVVPGWRFFPHGLWFTSFAEFLDLGLVPGLLEAHCVIENFGPLAGLLPGGGGNNVINAPVTVIQANEQTQNQTNNQAQVNDQAQNQTNTQTNDQATNVTATGGSATGGTGTGGTGTGGAGGSASVHTGGASAVAGTGTITPPKAGDAGLAGASGTSTSLFGLGLAGLLTLSLAAAARFGRVSS